MNFKVIYKKITVRVPSHLYPNVLVVSNLSLWSPRMQNVYKAFSYLITWYVAIHVIDNNDDV